MTIPTDPYPFLAGGGEMGELTRRYNWSNTSLGTPDQWSISLRTLVRMMLTSRFPMLIFWGPELITFYNDAFRPSLGNNGKHPGSLGQPGEQSWAESWPIIGPMIYDIMDGGEAVWVEDQKLPLYRDGQMSCAYWTYRFSPLTDDAGGVNGILVTCSETTQAVENQERLALSEARFSRLIEQAPVAVALFSGSQFVISLANERVLEYWGRSRQEVMNKPLFDALPEAAGQGFEGLLLGVYSTGMRFVAKELTVTIERNGRLEPTYIDFVYEPFYESDGLISGVMVICTEITEQVLARQAVEATQQDLLQANQRLNLAMDAGRLGAYTLDLATGHMDVSAQCRANYGQPAQTPFDFADLLATIVADDRDRVQQAVTRSVENRTIYTAEYRISWPDGTLHWVKAFGQPEYGPDGQPIRITGVTQEITDQRMMQEELERQVKQRTEQLQASVADLRRSNENLEQFAYIASHDLQEPLRKIQQFGDLLKTRSAGFTGEELLYLERMQSAASRMSLLIKDLLAFSRISTRQAETAPVALSTVLEGVQDNLSVVIEESRAQIAYGVLPTVQGDAGQLSQLFQNLLSNAIKFSQRDQLGQPKIPHITIQAHPVRPEELPAGVRPTRQSDLYYCIEVKDNGIGFEEKYTDRIFQVFQRLHGKNEFAGTGIGLAVCQKVVSNHGGTITATSQLGQGATFSVYLPTA